MFQIFVTQQKSTIPNLTILEAPRSFISFGSVYSIRGLKARVAPCWFLQAGCQKQKAQTVAIHPLNVPNTPIYHYFSAVSLA